MIDVNALALRPDGAGVSTYIRETLWALPHDLRVRVRALVQADAVSELPAGVSPVPVPVSAGARRAVQSLRQRPGSGLVHSTDIDGPLQARGALRVVTVHDLAVFDAPWAFSRRRALAERLLIRHAMRVADVVVAVSEFTAGRVRHRFGRECLVTRLAPGRDFTPPPSGAAEETRDRYGLPRDYVLHVGTVEPRKDVARLLAACEDVGVDLVLVGAGGGQLSSSSRVRKLGFVPREDLPALMAGAVTVAYLSRYEGFGLPPLEALACGARVLTTDVADLRDVLGDAVTWAPAAGSVSAALRLARESGRPEVVPHLGTWSEHGAPLHRLYRESLGPRR